MMYNYNSIIIRLILEPKKNDFTYSDIGISLKPPSDPFVHTKSDQ